MIEFAGQSYAAQPGETVLDCLLRHGAEISYSCKSGACQSCLMQAAPGSVPASSQAGLKDTQRQQGYFLACSCTPENDLTVKQNMAERIPVAISRLDLLSPSVMRVGLKARKDFAYQAGQFVTLVGSQNQVARSYSLASLPSDDQIELHVRRIPGGAMSGWLFEKAKVGEQVEVEGPKGSCCYAAGKPEQPLLLAGTGTGLAPLIGIARDALQQEHSGPIRLFHGALNRGGLYLQEELRALAGRFSNFEYVPVTLEEPAEAGGEVGTLDACVLRRIPVLDGWRVYVCGDPGFVNPFKKKIFLAGAASREIYADAFVPAAA